MPGRGGGEGGEEAKKQNGKYLGVKGGKRWEKVRKSVKGGENQQKEDQHQSKLKDKGKVVALAAKAPKESSQRKEGEGVRSVQFQDSDVKKARPDIESRCPTPCRPGAPSRQLPAPKDQDQERTVAGEGKMETQASLAALFDTEKLLGKQVPLLPGPAAAGLSRCPGMLSGRPWPSSVNLQQWRKSQSAHGRYTSTDWSQTYTYNGIKCRCLSCIPRE